MNLANSVTPENIIDITIQYQLPSSGLQVAIPSIFIRYFGEVGNNNTIRQSSIELAEVLPYMRYLEIQAAVNAIGQVLIAVQSTSPDGKQYTKITIGEPVVPPPITGTINFKVDGVDFDSSNTLTNLSNITGAGVADRGIDNTPFIVLFRLPKISDTFLNDYNPSFDGDLANFVAVDDGGVWQVTAFLQIVSNGAYHLGFTTIGTPAIITVNTPTGLHDSDFTPQDSNINAAIGNTLQWMQNEGTVIFSLPKINGDFFANDYSFSASGADVFIYATDGGANWNVFLTVSSNPPVSTIITLTAKPFNANVLLENGNNNSGTILNSLALNANAITPLNESGYVGGFGFDVAAVPLQINQFACGRSLLIQSGVKTGTFNADFSASSAIVGSIIAIGKSVIETPFTVPSTGNYDFPFDYEMTDEGFLTLILNYPNAGITPPPPTGVPVQAAAGNTGTSAALCPAPLTTYFTDDGTITTGKIVYTDNTLLTPLAGNDFILSPDGNIYAINNVTGLVGAVTGNSCSVPTTGKNMFVISTAANQLDIDGIDYGAHGAGSNYNAVIKSNSIITNNSGGSRTFNFYKQAPFIPANLTSGSGSPAIVANAGTYNLPNTITDYNYLVIT